MISFNSFYDWFQPLNHTLCGLERQSEGFGVINQQELKNVVSKIFFMKY
jgi:hypothetical protein